MTITPKKSGNVPQNIIADLNSDALGTSLFEVAGGSGAKLRCRLGRRLSDDGLTALTGWLDTVVGRIREFETVIPDEGEQVAES